MKTFNDIINEILNDRREKYAIYLDLLNELHENGNSYLSLLPMELINIIFKKIMEIRKINNIKEAINKDDDIYYFTTTLHLHKIDFKSLESIYYFNVPDDNIDYIDNIWVNNTNIRFCYGHGLLSPEPYGIKNFKFKKFPIHNLGLYIKKNNCNFPIIIKYECFILSKEFRNKINKLNYTIYDDMDVTYEIKNNCLFRFLNFLSNSIGYIHR